MRMGAFLLMLALVAPAAAQEPKPLRLIAEAEDFKVEKPGWKVVPFRENYYASTFAISFLSRMACLGAPAQLPAGTESVATQLVQIPNAGDFQVFARFEQPFNFSVEFTIAIEQNGKKVYSEMFGKVEDVKIWALNGNKHKPMERFWWGGTDNIVWQTKGVAKLAKGPATIRLIAGPQMDGAAPRVLAAARNVDTILLTNDEAGIISQGKTRYLPMDGWLTQAGDIYVRFTNPKEAEQPCVPIIEPNNQGQHSPYYIHIRDWPTVHVLKSGYVSTDSPYELTGPRSLAVSAKNLAPQLERAKFAVDPVEPKPTKGKAPKSKSIFTIPPEEYLKPGESSGWVPLGQALDSLHNCKWAPKMMTAKPTAVNLKLEFAIPDGKGGLKVLREATIKDAATYFEMPGNIAANPELTKALSERFWLPEIRTQHEALKWLLAEVEKFPKKGSTPKRFLLYNIMGFGFGLGLEDGRKLATALGDNTAVGQEGKQRVLAAHWRDPSLPAVEKKLAEASKDLLIVSYGDEIHLPAIPPSDQEWANFLSARGVPISGLLPYTEIAKDKANPLYYYAMLCAKEKGGKIYAAATERYSKNGVLTGANYSPHANYLINEMDYVRPFKMKAMSMPWSEDYVWQIPEFSIQATGYLTSGLRAGAKYHNQPIHMYILPHSPGNTPSSFRRSFYTAIGHGARMINYFCASPLAVGNTENYIDTNDLGMWKALHRTSHEAGIFEDYVMDGKVRPAKAGLLLSSVDDVLTGSSNSTLALHNNERKALYYALRHSQVPVDFVSEDDVIEGLCKDYKVIYVTQQWVHSKAIAALSKWVDAGGTVVALAGGGFANEFQKANPEANAFYGIKSQQLDTDPQLVKKYLLEENKPFLTKQDLPVYVPIDKVRWSTAERKQENVPVIVWKQKLEPTDPKSVVGTYADGSPAVVERKQGKGRVVLFGFMPGQAYLKSGLPILPPDRGSTDAAFAHFLPTSMDISLREALVDEFLPKDFVKPVVCSEPLVESMCIDTTDKTGKATRLAVPLVNFTGKNIEKLTVRINGLAGAKSIRSVEHGVLKSETVDGALVVTLPIAEADMLLIDR